MNWKKKLLAIILIIMLLGFVGLIVWSCFDFKQNWPWVLLFAILVYGINILLAIYIFYSKHRSDKEKKCWMAINILMPVIGPILFLKYGYFAHYKNNWQELTNNKNQLDKLFVQPKIKKSNNELYERITKFIEANSINKPGDGTVEKIKNIEDLFQTSIELIRSSKKIILINFYIIKDSRWLKAVANELYLKVKEGVKVYFLYDPFGSRQKGLSKIIKQLAKNGINTAQFKAIKTFYVTSTDNSRSHKKSLIIDGEVCLTGGFNIADEYINLNPNYHFWIDEGYIFKGNIVNEYIKTFASDWMVYGNCKHKQKLMKDIEQTKILCDKKINADCLIQMYNSNPEILDKRMIDLIYLILSGTKKRLYIHTPYLYLSEDQLIMFSNLAKTGVDVRIIVPRHNDNKKFIVAMNSLQYQSLISNGIKIYEIDGFIHSKSIIADDLVIVGTCNLDQRAMCLNYENVAIIDNASFNDKMTKEFMNQIAKAKEIKETFKKDISLRAKILVKLLMIVEMIF